MMSKPPCSVFALLVCSALAACSDAQTNSAYADPILVQDPIIARALSDPLMVDPDLASRNRVTAVIAFHDGHPLPPFVADDEAANRAIEAARLELADGRQIADLPAPTDGQGSPALGSMDHAGDILAAVGSRTDCIEGMDASLIWSTQMPVTSAVMPHGMVQQAAGVDEGDCVIRVVRYHTPVGVEDALEYHFAKAERDGFAFERFEQPEAQIRGNWRDEALHVFGREGPGGMTEVDVIHWRQ